MEDLQPVLDRRRVTRHLKDDVDTHPAVGPPNVLHCRIAWWEDGGRPHPLGQLPPVRIGLHPVDRGRPLGPSDADGAQADRPQPEDRDGVVFQRPRQGRVDRIPEWLLQGGDFGAESRRIVPAIFGRQQHVAGERPVAIDAEHPHVLAQVEESALALPAGVVDDVGLGCYEGPQRQS